MCLLLGIYSHQKIWVHSTESFVRVELANLGSCERKEFGFGWKYSHVGTVATMPCSYILSLEHDDVLLFVEWKWCQLFTFMMHEHIYIYISDKYRTFQILSAFNMVDVCIEFIDGKTHTETTRVWNPYLYTKLWLTACLSSIQCLSLTWGFPWNMTTARCPKMDDETVPIHQCLPPKCSQVFTFDDWMIGHPPAY